MKPEMTPLAGTLYEDMHFFSQYRHITETNVDVCVPWLRTMGLTRTATTLQGTLADYETISGDQRVHFGVPCNRVQSKTQKELKQLLEEAKRNSEFELSIPPGSYEDVWQTHRNRNKAIRLLDFNRIPADAMAFYRPFHFEPYHDWGIYLRVDKLLDYCRYLRNNYSDKLILFPNLSLLLGYVTCEIFHHEFFHHIVESAATSIEVVSAGFGKPRRIYLDYFEKKYESKDGLGRHPDRPLEEALANAYAYNSFSFLSRVTLGYKVATVKFYQDILKKYWPKESPGYRSAANYINEGYISGSAQLLGMMLGVREVDPASTLMVAKNVLLSGHSALLSKPEIPTYLVGTDEAIEAFNSLIPAPVETYTSLFWPGTTDSIDAFLRKRSEEEKARKKKQKG